MPATKVSKDDSIYILHRIPNLSFFDKLKIRYLDEISDDIVIEIKKYHQLKMDEFNRNINIFFDSILNLFTEFDINHSGIFNNDDLKNAILEPNETNDAISITDLINKIKVLDSRNKNIVNEIRRTQNLKSNSEFINYFKNNSIKALYVSKSKEIIFLKEKIFVKGYETEVVLKIFYILDFEKLKFSIYPCSEFLGYQMAVQKDKEKDIYFSFIYDFHLKARDKSFRRKGIGTLLEGILVKSAIEHHCKEIRGELSYIDMNIPDYKERLIGFWSAMGYSINNRNILKKL